ncbi:sulfatase-like hydrolase/transferase, partial [Verrucomicrobia bacterium]|nr:sulfatase-like hydrolase/transferase [Verrucomicrobiota bacterium]
MIKFVIHRIQGAAAVVRGTPFIKMWSRSMFQVACLLIVLGMSALAGAGERQPNLVVLFADDLGYGELSCQGNPEIPTPHIDSIARNGVRFTSGYVAGPNCSPSRAGL